MGNGLLKASGQLVMRGDLAADGIQRRPVHAFHRLCDALMEQTPPRRALAVVGHLAQLVVGEVIGRRVASGDVAHDAPLPQLIQAVHQRLLILIARVGQHRPRELAADRGRQAGQRARVR